MQYENAEDGENIVDVLWDEDYDGVPDVLPVGIPRGWEKDPPKQGLLNVTYACAPEF